MLVVDIRYCSELFRVLDYVGDTSDKIGVKNLVYMLEHPVYLEVPLSKG